MTIGGASVAKAAEKAKNPTIVAPKISAPKAAAPVVDSPSPQAPAEKREVSVSTRRSLLGGASGNQAVALAERAKAKGVSRRARSGSGGGGNSLLNSRSARRNRRTAKLGGTSLLGE